MSCNCNEQFNNGVSTNNSVRGRQRIECGSRCGCGSYFCNNRNCVCRNNTMNAGTAGQNNDSMQNIGVNSNIGRMSDLRLATSYVLPQSYVQSYTPEESLARGTCFPELDIDY